MINILSWNIARRDECWEDIFQSDYDIALLQEAHQPMMKVPDNVIINPGEWKTAGYSKRNWRTAIVILSDKVDVEWISCNDIESATQDELAVSRMGTITVAKITPKDGSESFIIASCYAVWEKPLAIVKSKEIFSDASAHKIISDISALIGSQKKHRILVSGDFNILKNYGENGSKYWAKRFTSVFDRFEAIGIPFIGPNHPNGRQAIPWPDELPLESTCVPTFYHSRQTPKTATRQLDFVFASQTLDIHVEALNQIEEWGVSDHCKLTITL